MRRLEIVYYPFLTDGPVRVALLEVLARKPKAYLKLAKDLETLGAQGIPASGIDIRHLGSGLWELKRSFDKIRYRILFGIRGHRAWLLDFFEKETQKTPHRILDRAHRPLKEVTPHDRL